MRKAQLLSTVAATLLLTVGAASAQGVRDEAPARAPAAQQNAPAEKVAPSLQEGQRKGSETTGQAQQEMKPGERGKSPTTGQAPRDSSPNAGAKESSEPAKPGMKRSEERGGNDMKAKPDSKAEGATTNEKSRTTTGQGAAAGSAKLSTEQRTKITTIIRQNKVEPTRLNVSVRVGTRIPESVRFHALPVEVIEVYPQWRGYNYILVGEQIVVIDPGTHEIVAIIEA